MDRVWASSKIEGRQSPSDFLQTAAKAYGDDGLTKRQNCVPIQGFGHTWGSTKLCRIRCPTNYEELCKTPT